MSLSPKISDVFDKEFKPLLPTSSDLKAVNEEFIRKHNDAYSLLAAAHVRQVIDPQSNRTQASKDFIKIVEQESTSLRLAQASLDLLKHWNAETDLFMAAAKRRWPEATIFKEVS